MLTAAGCIPPEPEFEVGLRLSAPPDDSDGPTYGLLRPSPVPGRLLFLEGQQLIQVDLDSGQSRVVDHHVWWIVSPVEQAGTRMLREEPTGRWIVHVSGMADGRQRGLFVHDTADGTSAHVGYRRPQILGFLGMGRWLMLIDDVSSSGRLVAWDLVEQRRLSLDAPVHSGTTTAHPVDPAGRRFAYVYVGASKWSSLGELRVWDAETGDIRAYGHQGYAGTLLGFSEDGRFLAFVHWEFGDAGEGEEEEEEEERRQIGLLDFETDEVRLFGDNVSFGFAGFDGQGALLYRDFRGGESYLVRLDLGSFEEEVLVTGVTGRSFPILSETRTTRHTPFLSSLDGRWLLVFVSDEAGYVGELLIDQVSDTRLQLDERIASPGDGDDALQVGGSTRDEYVFSPDGRFLARRLERGAVSILDLDSGESWRQLAATSRDREATNLAFSADGRFLAFVARGDLRTGELRYPRLRDEGDVLWLYEVDTGHLRAINHGAGSERGWRPFVFADRHLIYHRLYDPPPPGGWKAERPPTARGIYVYDLPP